MKIKLKIDLPIPKENGAFKDKTFEVVRDTMDQRGREGLKLYYFIGDTGNECGAYPIEVELIK